MPPDAYLFLRPEPPLQRILIRRLQAQQLLELRCRLGLLLLVQERGDQGLARVLVHGIQSQSGAGGGLGLRPTVQLRQGAGFAGGRLGVLRIRRRRFRVVDQGLAEVPLPAAEPAGRLEEAGIVWPVAERRLRVRQRLRESAEDAAGFDPRLPGL